MYSKELVKGTIKPIILKMLSEKGRMYGYEIVQAVKALSQGKIHIKEGSLYPILHALKKEGVLVTESREVGGRTRKYYSISQKGTPQVEASLNELSDFVQTLQLILNPKVA
ncbi:MAG: PadR family transcriptional regulator [Bacteroidia bacterium]|nr:PadR family transcriptional regulator [Bacteroidia bacterium]